MTTPITIDTSAALSAQPESRIDAGSPQPGQAKANRSLSLSFSGIVRSERIKLSSLRSIRVTLALTVLMGLGMSALIAFMWREGLLADAGGVATAIEASQMQEHLLIAATFPAPFLALIFGVLGVFAISSEFTSGMILSTLAAVPRRTPVFVAKALVLALVASLTALVLVLSGLGLAIASVPETAVQLTSLPVVSGALGAIAYLLLIALFAFGVAGILRSTAGGIAVVAGVTFVLPLGLQMLSMSGWEWVSTALNYTPTTLGGILSQGIGEMNGAYGPGFWQALLAMAAWAAIVVVPAAIAFKRRDAK